jgi:signal transduction histidine kinase
MTIGSQTGDRGRWLTLLLLLIGVLAPTVSVLWFMNAAIGNQREASRQKLAEAYRGQLRLLRDGADAMWAKRGDDLARAVREGTAAAAFQRVIDRGLADSVIVLDDAGRPAYPAPGRAIAVDALSARPDWMAARGLEGWKDFSGAAAAYREIAKEARDPDVAARAAQGLIRCLARSGDKAGASRAIEEYFGGGRLARAADPGGRVIAADEFLLAAELDPAAAARLTTLLRDYSGAPIPSAQRVFLMDEAGGAASFPTYAAERLAAEFLSKERVQSTAGALEASGLPDTWKLAAPGGRVIGLYRTSTVISAIRGLSGGMSAALGVHPPGAAPAAAAEGLPAGAALPGWQISLAPPADARSEIDRRQTLSYIWVALLAIAVVAVTALAAGQAMRRQWRLARLKTDLVAAVSHELKTPLASMSVLVDSLLDDAAPDPRRTREYLELIARENLRLSRLIENFLTFSRLERRRQRFEFTATRPEEVVASAMEAVRERIPADCGIEVTVEPGLPAVQADADALVTVLLNLLDNAYKYTSGERRIVLRALVRAGHVVFEVEDNGIGIAAREQKRIFRRFYQVDQRLARDAGGCGLGLSIVDYIVKAHGGEVRVESEPGRGSRFSVALPCAPAVHGAAA